MQATLTREALLGLLEPIAKVTSHRLVGLQNVLLTAMDGVLQAQGTNFEAEIIRQVPAEVDTNWTVLVHCGRLLSIVKSLSSPAVLLRLELRSEGSALHIESGTARCALPIGLTEHYQAMPERGGDEVRVPTRLIAACTRVAYAGKKALEEYGLSLTTLDGAGAVCCTNGQRIAVVRDPELAPLPDAQIPPTLIAAFVAGAASGEETARMRFGDVLTYATERVTVRLQRSAAAVPPFARLIGQLNWPVAVVSISKAVLTELAARAEFFFDAASPDRLDLTVQPEMGGITAHLQSQLGALDEFLPAEDVSGETVTAGISPTYLREALAAMKSVETVSLAFGKVITDPLCILPFGDAGEIHIVGQRHGSSDTTTR